MRMNRSVLEKTAGALEERIEYANVTKLRNSLLRVVDQLQEHPALRFLIFKHGEPQAVLMSFQTYQLLKKVMNQALERSKGASREERIQAAFERLRAERPGASRTEAREAKAEIFARVKQAEEAIDKSLQQKDDVRALVGSLHEDLRRLDDILREAEEQTPGAIIAE